MKKCFLSLVIVAVCAAGLLFGVDVFAHAEGATPPTPLLVSPHLVISQFQAGGTSNANDEFIEIHNTSANPVDLNGYRVVYRSQNGTNDVNMMDWTTSVIVPPGGYYLIASNVYTGSAAPDITFNNSTCSCALAAGQGGLGIRQGPLDTGVLLDAVGWGTGSNILFEGTRTTAPGNNNSKARKQQGCQDTDDNAADFETLTPSAPRNSSTGPVTCGGSGETLFAAMNANPQTVFSGGTTLLTVSVVPATTPPSTGISVVGNLATIGGSASQQFFDDGTNGDVTPGDNVFSYLATVNASGSATVSAVASDQQGRTANAAVLITISGCPQNDQPLTLGNPSNATADIADETNYLMVKPQYTLSYHRTRGISNWAAWRLDSNWIGTTSRQDDFRPDTTLPSGWYRVTDQDYSGSGFDRGHLVPSGDRTCSVAANSATFLMTNIMPQAAANNQGPWAELENYSRALIADGNELYTYAGSTGQGGTGLNGFANTIANGNVTVPSLTWKVIVVLPVGSNDADRVTKTTRTIAVIMPNQQSIGQGTPWRNFRTSIRSVEALTGLNFLTNVRPIVRNLVKQRRDTL